MIVTQNELVTTFYNKEKKILVSVYKGRANIKLAIEHINQFIDTSFHKNNEVLGSIIDVKEVHGSFIKIFEYVKDFYYPVVVNNGLTCQAYVVSEDLIIKNLGLKMQQMASSFKLKSALFFQRKEAEKWVNETLDKINL